ncbi:MULTISPECIES: hypothetical protein [Nocardia]|uniref:hypothetical protein n=1 Tax=Nocardia TaxID=1817 RepID=UPI0013008EC7|nr:MULTISPECIES: hypothetical protein [Nocardia]
MTLLSSRDIDNGSSPEGNVVVLGGMDDRLEQALETLGSSRGNTEGDQAIYRRQQGHNLGVG